METAIFFLCLIIMLIGLAGVVLPVIPSVPIIYAAYFIFGFASKWQYYGSNVMVLLGVITALVLALDYIAGAMGAKRYGASRAGMIGSVLGAIVGVIFFNIIGLIVGPFVGAVAGELFLGRSSKEAVRSGWGAFVGFITGAFLKLIAAVSMIGAFLWMVIM